MLTLIEGGFSSGLFEEIKKRILLSHERGRRIYLIVPEQQTVIAEAEMTDFMPPDAPLYFEVTNFTRLANSAFRTLGGIANEYCDGTKKTLIMWRALTELAPLLEGCRAMTEIPASLAKKYLAAVAEMQSAGIDADDIDELVKGEVLSADARLKGKLTDLGAVMTAYKRLLGERYSDISDDIGNLLVKLDENPEFLTDSDIYIDGFTSFTNGQYKLIGRLAARTSVTVTLTLPKTARDSFEYTETAGTHMRLSSHVKSEGADISLIKIEGKFGKSSELLYEAVDKIWHTGAKFDNDCLQNTDVLRIFASKTPFDMCDFVSADIMRRVNLGARFSDFAIVCASAERYAGILDMSLKKYGIPAFASYKRASDEFSVIKLILSAYRVIRSGFAREDVIAYAKCAFTGAASDDIDLFEIYVSKWQLSGRRFTDGLYWGMSPYGYDGRGGDEDAVLQRINAARSSIIDPLKAFAEESAECRTVTEHATALVKFLFGINAEQLLAKKAEELMLDGESSEAQEYSMLWQTVCRALDGLVEAVGDMEADTGSFPLLLKIVFSGIEIGRIPSYADEVTVGNADMLRVYGKKHLYLIGVNDGEFPGGVSSEGGYFAERERGLLALAGVELDAGEELRGARELFCFTRAMSYARESLTLIYSESTSALKPASPSDAISRLIDLSGKRISVVKTYELPTSELIWTPEAAKDMLGELTAADYSVLKDTLAVLNDDGVIRVAEADVTNDAIALSPELADSFYGKEMWLSQTKIDSYADCPMKHFCRFNLGLSDDEVYEFGARNIGIFIHAVLESFFRALRKSGGNADGLDEAEREQMLNSAAQEYLASLGDGLKEGGERMRIRIARLTRAAKPVVEKLLDEVKNSKYIPTFFELRLSDRDPALPDVPTFKSKDGSSVKISGIVDRVDTMQAGDDVYVRVLDYKTGSKLFSADDMENGRNLQMFIYLKAIYESKSEKFKEELGATPDGKILPAGVMYIGTSVKDVTVKGYDESEAISAVKAAQKCQGMLLDDQVSLDGMDRGLSPIKYTKGGISDSSKQFLYSAEDWDNIMQSVEGAVMNTAEQMRSGKIAPTPERTSGKNPCEYCEFKPICRRVSYNNN